MEGVALLLGIGSVIYLEYKVETDGVKNTKRHPIKYGSSKFNLTETLNTTSHERESMAIITSIKEHWDIMVAYSSAVSKTD